MSRSASREFLYDIDPPSMGERIYDGLTFFCLAWAAMGSMWLLGSTRVWGYAFGLVLSFIGMALVFLRPVCFSATPAWRLPVAWYGLLVLTVYVWMRIPFSAVPYVARWDALKWLSLCLSGWAWIQFAGRRQSWKWIVGLLLLVLSFECLYAIAQELKHSRMVLWIPRPEQYGTRASGTYICPNHFGNALAMLFPVALTLLLLPEAGFPLRLMSVYFFVLAAPVMYWTQSRSSWIGVLGGVAATLFLLAWRKSRKWMLLALILIPLGVAAVGAAAWATLPAVRERVGAVLENHEQSGGSRLQSWRDTPAMIQDKPVFGFGGGSFLWVYPPYQRHVAKFQHMWDYLHNEYLQMQVEYGAVGLALAALTFLIFLWTTIRCLLKARSNASAALLAGALGAWAAALLHAFFDFNFHIFPNPHILMCVSGCAYGVYFAMEYGPEPRKSFRSLRMGLAVCGGCICLAAAWLSFKGGMSYAWNVKGELFRGNLDMEEAEAAYQKSIKWDSWNWNPYLGLGKQKATAASLFYVVEPADRALRIQLGEDALEWLRKAEERNPYDMSIEFTMARAKNAMYDRDGALEHYCRAAEFQQAHRFYREQLGIQLRNMGRDEEALAVFEKNVADGVYTDISHKNIRTLKRRIARLKQAAAEEAAASAP